MVCATGVEVVRMDLTKLFFLVAMSCKFNAVTVDVFVITFISVDMQLSGLGVQVCIRRMHSIGDGV